MKNDSYSTYIIGLILFLVYLGFSFFKIKYYIKNYDNLEWGEKNTFIRFVLSAITCTIGIGYMIFYLIT